MNTLKTVLVITFYALAFFVSLGLIVPYLEGYHPPVATIERKYRIRGWLLMATAWLYNAVMWWAFTGWHIEHIVLSAVLATVSIWFFYFIGHDENPSHFEYM